MPTMTYEAYLSTGNKLGEFVRTNTFEVFIEGELADICPLHVVSCTLPLPNVDPIEVPHFNVTNKVAGRPSFDNVELVVRQTFDPEAASKIWDWVTKVFNPETGEVGYASEYKKNGTLIQYDPKGKQVAVWELIGLWPQSVTGFDLSYDGSDPVQVSLSLTCDYVKKGAGAGF